MDKTLLIGRTGCKKNKTKSDVWSEGGAKVEEMLAEFTMFLFMWN